MKFFPSLTAIAAISVVSSMVLPALLLFSPGAQTEAVSWPFALAANAAETSESDQITRVLNRLTYGPRPGDFEKVRSLGIQGFIQAQLNPTSIAESPKVIAQLERSAAVRNVPSSQLMQQFQAERKERKALKNKQGGGQGAAKGARLAAGNGGAAIQEFGKRRAKTANGDGKLRNEIESGVIETKIIRAVESPRQLNELMADFWFNHFNISIGKGIDRVLIGPYEEQAIRPYLFGNFRDLLGATMHHPAMMFYLDNAQNTKAGFQSANPKNKKNGLNENYARELLELHTLGVDGGYSQKDVMELARVLTGWGLPGGRKNSGGGAYWASFDERRHDFGDKVVLGQTIKGSGPNEIEQVLDMLARHNSTAHHLSFKLAQYFVDDNPPDALVDKLSSSYLQSGGNIKSVLNTLFASQEFWDSQYQNSKFKSPFHYLVSSLRATGATVRQPKQLAAFLKTQGQPLYACLTPDGYKNTKEAWLNPGGLLKRMDFALRLAGSDSTSDYQTVLGTVNGGKLSPQTRQAIDKAPPGQRVAALIGSPEFMNY
ncbi:MAG: DUF1800 domain-containing protein [Candidatus Melainabacteria bacterium]|nr:DUF1800 domain-containing protein [Candidatus Melainabacteria bacterium]